MVNIIFSEYFNIGEDGNLMDFNDRVNELLKLDFPIQLRFDTPDELLKFVTTYQKKVI